MNRSLSSSHLALFLLSALTLVSAATGCATKVASGEGGSGGESSEGGSGGEGGGDVAACNGVFTGAGCTPGATQGCSVPEGNTNITGTSVCQLVSGCETEWNFGCNTPLVLSFDGAPVSLVADSAHGFDLNGGASLVTDWPTARTPWLAIDRDGNGSIDDGSELFGSMSPLAGGGRAPNGFAALRELDTNGDGRITAEDAGFSRLLVWSDRDGDRRSSPGELTTAAEAGIVSIDLGFVVSPRCDARGNCEVERATFQYRDAGGVVRTGAVVDVHFAPQAAPEPATFTP